jgi:hypothetical protein
VKNAAEMVWLPCTARCPDGHATGTDHAKHLAHLSALLIMRKLAQSIQSIWICTARATAHGGGGQSPFRSTYMKLTVDSVNEISPDLLYMTRTCRAVNGHAVGSDGSRVRGRRLVQQTTATAPRPCTRPPSHLAGRPPTQQTCTALRKRG